MVTGLGLVTPVGNTTETTWASLLAGKSGAAPITKFDPSKYQVRFAVRGEGLRSRSRTSSARKPVATTCSFSTRSGPLIRP